MAHVLRLKLQALYCPRRLSSPAVASKLFQPRHIPWRCYGESALLDESCNSTLNANDIDGDSKAAIAGGDSATKGVEDGASKESNLDKLTSSICDKLWAKANVAGDEKYNKFQGQGDPLLTKESKKTEKDILWDSVVNNVRTMVLKNKAKAVASDMSGLPKTEANESDFSDLDLPEAGGEFGVSRGRNATNKDSLVMNAFGKSFKQKSSQPQISHQQKSKDTRPLGFLKSLANNTTLSSLKSPDDNASTTQTKISKNNTASLLTETDFTLENINSGVKPSKSWDRNKLRIKDLMPGGVDLKMSKGKDSSLPLAAEDGSCAQVWNQSRGKETTQGMPDFKAKGSGNTPPAQLHGKIPSYASEATYQPSHNDNSVPRTGYMVCVPNLPASCNPAMIKASMAIHGEVLGFYKKSAGLEHFHVYIQFKTAQASEAALWARKLQIGSKSYTIMRTDQIFSTVVRLSKVSMDTTEKQLFSMCGKYGSIDNIRKRSNGVYDVFYQVKELPNMTSILGSLNEVTLNRGTWIAVPAPALHPSVQKEALKSPEGQAWHEVQVNQALNRIETGIDGVVVLFEDLKELTALGKEYSKW